MIAFCKLLSLSLIITTAIFSVNSVYAQTNLRPDSVEVFVTFNQYKQTVDISPFVQGLSIYQIDNVNRIEKQISKSIPSMNQEERRDSANGIQRYKKRVLPLILKQAKNQKKKLMNTWGGISKMIGYGINRTPAVIINHKYIIYGTSVSLAVYKWKKHINFLRKNNDV